MDNITSSDLAAWRAANHDDFVKAIPTAPAPLGCPPCHYGAACNQGRCSNSTKAPAPAEACSELQEYDDICRPPFNVGTLIVVALSFFGVVGVIAWAVLSRW